MKKGLISKILVFMVLTTFSLTGCGDSNATSENSGEKITIKLAGSVPDDHPITQGNFKFKELLEERTDGRFEVEVYPAGQLGSNREFYEACQNGNVQMAEAGAVILAAFTDKFKFMQMPYLFNSSESVQNFLNSEIGQQMCDEIGEETGLLPVAFYENGWQAVTNSKKEIHSPADLKGLKIRTQENNILLKIYETMGANPMPMAFTELFTAMQQKTVDGQVNPILIADTGNYYEVQSYLTDVNAVYDLASLVINKDFFDSLSEEDQITVKECAKEACEYQLKASSERSKQSEEKMKDLIKITYLTDEERAAFKDITLPVYDWFRESGVEPNLDQYLEAIKISNEKYEKGELEAITGDDL